MTATLAGPECEACGFRLPFGYSWRVKCVVGQHLHVLCVDCGCRLAQLTGLQESVWAELDACPAEVAVAWALMGESGKSAESEARKVLQKFEWEPTDEKTRAQVVPRVRAAGLPADEAMLNARGKSIGVLLADGRAVWFGPDPNPDVVV